jgi:hypothetical protein
MLRQSQEPQRAEAELAWRGPTGYAAFEALVRAAAGDGYTLDAHGREVMHMALLGSGWRPSSDTDASVAQAARRLAEEVRMGTARTALYERQAHGPLPCRHHVVYSAGDRRPSGAGARSGGGGASEGPDAFALAPPRQSDGLHAAFLASQRSFRGVGQITPRFIARR